MSYYLITSFTINLNHQGNLSHQINVFENTIINISIWIVVEWTHTVAWHGNNQVIYVWYLNKILQHNDLYCPPLCASKASGCGNPSATLIKTKDKYQCRENIKGNLLKWVAVDLFYNVFGKVCCRLWKSCLFERARWHTRWVNIDWSH